MNPIRFGVIGLKRGQSFVRVCRAVGGVAVTSLFDIDLSRAERSAAEIGATAFGDLDAFLRADIDAVVIASPVPYHAAQAVAALEAGRHVLSEVTACNTLAEAKALVQAARASRAVYMMAENYRYLDEVELIKRVHDDGRFGEVYYAEGEYIHDCKDLWYDEDGSLTWRGGGALGVYCTHSLGPLLYVTGDRVATVSVLAVPGGKFDRRVTFPTMHLMQMVTVSGVTLRVRVDHVSPHPHQMAYYAMQGTHGSYVAWRGFGDRGKLWLADEHEPSTSHAPARWHALEDQAPRYIPERLAAPLEARSGGHGTSEYWLLRDFLAAVTARRDSPADRCLPGAGLHAAGDLRAGIRPGTWYPSRRAGSARLVERGPHVHFAHPSFSGLIGVSRRDITPPRGIYARSWGAAPGDVAEGVHRPLTATALALRARPDTAPLVLLALDLGWWKTAEDEWSIRGRVLEALGLDQSRVLINLSHTHAGPSTSLDDADKPGGALVGPYRATIVEAAVAAAQQAIATSEEARLAWATGRCALAQNRDLFDGDRHVCGFNPFAPADDTLLVGRVTSAAGTLVATIVNYACHPTTLAWENPFVSPDYVGAMRELVENRTGHAPCLFLQGASGELAPREQYTGDTVLVDKNGRTLAFAVLATLEGMLPPSMQLEYAGPVESGAPLAVWRRTPQPASGMLRATRLDVDFEVKELPQVAELERRYPGLGTRVLVERLARARQVRRGLGDSRTTTVPLALWRLGDAIVVAQPNEAYSWLQTELRRCFADRAVIVMNLAGGYGRGYLPRAPLYDHEDLYEVWQTPYARGSLERVADAAKQGIVEHLLAPDEGASGKA